MLVGQTNLVQFLFGTVKEFFFYSFFTTINASGVSSFENNNRKKIFIRPGGINSPVNIFFTHSPPDEIR